MKKLKVLFLSCAIALLACVAFTPASNAQISINIGVPPSCPYGYYEYPPYQCAPGGFYGPGYFYNGVFLGVGPWAHWGYRHGWGSHRFVAARGGYYVPGRRYAGGAHPEYRGRARGPVAIHGDAYRGGGHPGGEVRGGGDHHDRGGHPVAHGGGGGHPGGGGHDNGHH